MGAGRVLCDDVLRRRMRTCVLSVSSTVGRSVGRFVDPGTTSRHFGAETKKSNNFPNFMSPASKSVQYIQLS